MATGSDVTLALAATVRRRRLELGLTQAVVAARVGVALPTYIALERTGATTLDRLARVAEALGLMLTLNAPVTTALVADPRLTRKRGLRRLPDAAANAASAEPAAHVESTTPAKKDTARRGVATKPQPQPPSAAAAAEMLKKHRDAIYQLVGVIVRNRLTNHTCATVVRNVMRSQRDLPPDALPAFVAAVDGELARLDEATIAEFGLGLAAYKTWAATWDPELGILNALD